MARPTFSVITLGCPRNYVDSQFLVKEGIDKGWEYVSQFDEADYVFINTCGFIQPAIEESIDIILQIEELYQEGKVKEVWIVGCLVERFEKELKKEFPWAQFRGCIDPCRLSVRPIVFAEGGYAYVKICEGCISLCSFCTIPSIRGPLRSRRIEDVVSEVRYVSEELGKGEVVLVGQDTTAYGIDIYRKPALEDLLNAILDQTNVRWIRLMYAYPSRVGESLLDLIAHNNRIVPYIDLPIQHINSAVLNRMNRGYDQKELDYIFDGVRERGIKVRTTIIVGFPGEGRKEFSQLRRFLEERKEIVRIGVFRFYPEIGTPAYSLQPRPKPSTVKGRYYRMRRLANERLMEFKQSLSGQVLDVIVDGFIPEIGLYLARTYWDAPEVDDILYLHSKTELFSGDLVRARISYSKGELIGEVVD